MSRQVSQKMATQSLVHEAVHLLVDWGFRSVDHDNPDAEIIHRSQYRSLRCTQRRWLKRRPAIEPAIGHLKQDHRMDRCWLQGGWGMPCTPSCARPATTCAG